MVSAKHIMVGSTLGIIAGTARDALDILRATYADPEAVGMIANDQLATRLTVRMCQPNAVFIDVGAHIGSITAAVAHHDPSVSIIAIEAIPAKAEFLRRKFRAVEIHECAVGESEGAATFFVNTKQSGYSSLGRPDAEHIDATREIVVRVSRLDEVVKAQRVDVMKIDVEGAELGVLRGGDRLVSTNRPTIMFESGAPIANGLGYTKRDLWQWFEDHEYEVVIPNRLAHDGPSLSVEGFAESHCYPRRTTNYFGVPTERRMEIRDRARRILEGAT